MTISIIESINLTGVRIHSLSRAELNAQINNLVGTDGKHIVSNVNIHGMNIASKNDHHRQFLNDATINFCDGDGVRLTARLFGKKIVEKITYNRWIWDLAALSQTNGHSWYMLGSTEKSITQAVNVLEKKYPQLHITGYRNGYINNEDERQNTINQINKCAPDILIVGMGMPIQEQFLIKNSKHLMYKVALTAGAAFDYISGKAKMTPSLYKKLKLEWFYRLMNEPNRLAKRYLIGNPAFVLRVFKDELL